MNKCTTLCRYILLILGTIIFIGYIIFLIGEGVPIFRNGTFEDLSVYLLFLIFIMGYVFLWKNEIISGIIIILWHIFQLYLVILVWHDGELTLIIGIPICIYGILVLIYGIRRKISSLTTFET